MTPQLKNDVQYRQMIPPPKFTDQLIFCLNFWWKFYSHHIFMEDPSTIQPFIVWSIACSPTYSACILIDSLLLGFLRDPSLDTSRTPSVAPWSSACNNPSRLQFNACAIHRSLDWWLIHRSLDWSLIHRLYYPSLLLLIKTASMHHQYNR